MIGFEFLTICEEIENFSYLGGLGIFPSNIGNKAFGGGKICSFDKQLSTKISCIFPYKAR